MKAWWQRRTLRFRLAVWYAAGGTLLLAGFSATLYLYVAQTMARPLDHELREDLAEIRRRLAVTAERGLRWDGAAVPAEVRWDPDAPWFELWDEQGGLVRRFGRCPRLVFLHAAGKARAIVVRGFAPGRLRLRRLGLLRLGRRAGRRIELGIVRDQQDEGAEDVAPGRPLRLGSASGDGGDDNAWTK